MANQVVESGRIVVVKATLTIPDSASSSNNTAGTIILIGAMHKGACTEALSKCASYLGIGMDVYKGLRDEKLRAPSTGNSAAANGAKNGAPLSGSQPRNKTARPIATGLTSNDLGMIAIIGRVEFARNPELDLVTLQVAESALACAHWIMSAQSRRLLRDSANQV